jgi:hypothetical protein
MGVDSDLPPVVLAGTSSWTFHLDLILPAYILLKLETFEKAHLTTDRFSMKLRLRQLGGHLFSRAFLLLLF